MVALGLKLQASSSIQPSVCIYLQEPSSSVALESKLIARVSVQPKISNSSQIPSKSESSIQFPSQSYPG